MSPSAEEMLYVLNAESTRVHVDNLRLIGANESLRRERDELLAMLKRARAANHDYKWGTDADALIARIEGVKL